MTANPNTVYALAQIPPPAAPTPAPTPGEPTNITVTLNSTGAITLAWKAVNSAPNAGTFFSVRRKIGGGGGGPLADARGSLIGNTGGKTFTDDTLVQGTPIAIYIIQGHRGTLSGIASEQVGVQCGVAGPGISVTNATAGGVGVKLAA